MAAGEEETVTTGTAGEGLSPGGQLATVVTTVTGIVGVRASCFSMQHVGEEDVMKISTTFAAA